jgi:hypothetical protein
MKIACALAIAAVGVSIFAFSRPAQSGDYAPAVYDANIFSYEYPAYTGGNATAVAVDLVNSRFLHRRITGPAIAYRRGYLPRAYRVRW